MAIPADYSVGDEVLADDVNSLRDLGYTPDLNAGETINGATLPVPVYQDTADNELKACDANDQVKLEFIGFAISNSTDGNPIDFQTTGVVGGFSGLAEGEAYYVQDTAGTIGTTIGTYEVFVGYAISTTQLLITKGAKAGMQYCGNEADGGDDSISVPAVARFAIVSATANTGGGHQAEGDIFLSRHGKTSGEIRSAGGTTPGFGCSASWSGSTITLSVTGTDGNFVSGTAYFYR